MAVFVALAVVLATAVAGAAGAGTSHSADPQVRQHDLPSPLSEKQRALRAQALELQAKGKIAKSAKVGKVAKGQYVELARTGEDSIWTVLGEFSDFAHNQIAEPDRTEDNTTIWEPDFSQSYYKNLLFNDSPGANSMRNFYIEQSSNRYTVNGDVTDWAQVPGTAADYGSNTKPDSATWPFLRDTVNTWYENQI
ncbi:MAG TPA: immune inhibitor A domain-containing protein, partial [Gaiellaceae bacterium]|nr:immune inhibitor A domain-containing protein [Gaiellaceae bacterium]